MVNYYAKLSKLIDSRDTDETDDSTVHEFKSFKPESGPGKWYTCKYQGDYHVIDDGITSLYTCTEEADLLIPTFLSDKDFSPNQIEHDLFFKTSARDEYIHFVQIFFQQSSRLPPKRYCVTKIILEEVPCSRTQ